MLWRCAWYWGRGLASQEMSFVARVSRRRQNTGQADPGPEGGRKVYFFLSPPLASSFFPGAAPLAAAAAGAAPGAAFPPSPAAGAAPGAAFTSPGAPSTAATPSAVGAGGTHSSVSRPQCTATVEVCLGLHSVP